MRESLARIAKYWPVMLFVTWHEGTLTVFAAWGAQTQALLAWIASGAVLGPLAGRMLHRAGVPGPRDGEAADGETADDSNQAPCGCVPRCGHDDVPADPAAPDDFYRAPEPLQGGYRMRLTLPPGHQPGRPVCPCDMCVRRRSYEQDTPGT